MGLDISYNAFNAPYGAFMRFRLRLSKIVGIPELEDMEGFGGSGSWDKYNHDALCILINHSDCDGDIPFADCIKLLARMKEITKGLEPDDELLVRTNKFILGLEDAIKNNDGLEFS